MTARPDPASSDRNSIAELLAAGLMHHKAGRAQDAARIYSRVLQHDADQPHALHLLGEIAHRAGDSEKAARLIGRAVLLLPGYAEAHNNLGAAYQALGRLDEAEASYRRAVALKPGLSIARSNLGAALTAMGRKEDARRELEKALSIDPDASEARLNLGNLLREAGHLAEAEACQRHVLGREPGNAAAWNNLGATLLEAGRLDDARDALERAAALDPGSAEAHHNLGSALRKLGRMREATDAHRRAVALRPDSAEYRMAYGAALRGSGDPAGALEAFRAASRLAPSAVAQTTIGSILIDLGDLAAAETAFVEAIRIDPECAEAHAHLGSVQRNRRDLPGAIASYRRSLALDPGNALTHNNLGGALLLSEAWSDGWAEFEWRWRLGDNPALRARHRLPLWQGDSLKDRRILLWGEQGIGDVVLFATMLPDLIAIGAHVSLELDPRLVPLFRRSFPSAEVFAWGAVPADAQFDCQANLGRLGLFRRTSPQSFANSRPYLRPDAERVASFRRRYAALGAGAKIGVAWRSTSPVHPRKSLALEDFAPLFAAMPDASFISLQYGDTADERARLNASRGIELIHDDSFDNWADLDGLAAQIASLDHVVTVSNLNAHLAGAAGVPADVVVAANVLWHWPDGRPNTPWYGSLRLHHANAFASPAEAIEHLARRLPGAINQEFS